MQNYNWAEVEAASEGFSAPPAGGYVLQIVDVVDVPQREYLIVYYDIVGAADPANEEFTGYYAARNERSKGTIPFPAMYRSYKESARRFFKGFLVALEDSNTGSFVANTFDGDESKMKGLCIGAVLGEEEYEYNGKRGTRLHVSFVCSTARIQAGDFKVPAKRELPKAEPSPFGAMGATVANDRLPF